MAERDEWLAVCIPTYRRPDLLRRCVRSVIEAGASFSTPIVITDDSTDETNVDVIRELHAEYPFIEHRRNPQRLGIDGNIVHAMNCCPARYGWLLGEDDLLLPDAIRTIRAALTGDASRPFLFVNYAAVNEDYSRILKARAIPIQGDAEMEAAVFLGRYGWAAGFIGACVIDRAAWGAVRVEPYVGTWFAHVGGIMEVCLGQSVRLFAEPLVWNRTGSPGAFTWTGSMLDVLDGWRRLMRLLEPLYGEAVCTQAAEAFIRAHGLNTIAFLGYARAGGALTPELVRREIVRGAHPLLFKWAAVGIARLPVGMCRALHRAWLAISSRRARAP